MNEPIHSALPDERWAEDFTRAIGRQRSRAQEFLAALRERERNAQAELASLIERWRGVRPTETSSGGEADVADQVLDLRGERDRLAENLREAESRLAAMTGQLAEMEHQLADAQVSAEGPAEEEYRRRYERALVNVRELEARNEELEQRLRSCAPGGAAHPGPSGKTLDWEAEKRRIVAALEAECDEGQPDAASRMELEKVVRATDQVVADKNREILELQRTLQDQSTNLASLAVGAAAGGAVLDQDAVVQEERESLRCLQREWEEKLRNAEVEISIERAKLARERAEIDDKIRALGGRTAKPDDSAGAGETSARPSHGRWLSRLGLKDADDAKPKP
jgi:hypothetical protein